MRELMLLLPPLRLPPLTSAAAIHVINDSDMKKTK
jgi:hypothetical protein